MHEAPNLAVEKRAFIRALKDLRISVRAKQNDEALIYFANGRLSIRLQDSTVEVPAAGTLEGRIRVNARTLIPLVTFPPDADPLPLSYHDERIFISRWSVNAIWEPGVDHRIGLADDASDFEILALEQRYSRAELADAGLSDTIEDAKQRRDQCVQEAASVLQSVGVTASDLQNLIADKLHSSVEADSSSRASSRSEAGDETAS